jgi:antibiotic biosynthesis monooxygenase (ABM) superfamily enzyme
MIKRIWHGWTTRGNADKYFEVLTSQVIPGIAERKIPGYRSFEVLRKDDGEEIEFVTIITFDSLQNVIDFQGEDYTRAYIPDAARAVLKRWDHHCSHYEAIDL